MTNKKYNYAFISHVVSYPTGSPITNPDQSTEIVSYLTAGYEIYKSFPLTADKLIIVLFILRKEI